MYIPAHFAEARPEALHRIIREHPLGMLVTHTSTGLDADHLPFELDASAGTHGALIAHVARANTLWQRCPTGTPVMVVFRGVQAYISPNWYPSKHESHRQVPTWNYGQNREVRDRINAADTLESRGHTTMAQAMRKAE